MNLVPSGIWILLPRMNQTWEGLQFYFRGFSFDLFHDIKQRGTEIEGECQAENGCLRVNKYLQVEGYDNVYAVGDCANILEPKLAYHAGLHAGVAVTNITNSLMEKPLKPYKPGSVSMLLAMGHNDGVGQFNGVRLPRFLVTKVKSKDLMLWKSWKEMGQKAP